LFLKQRYIGCLGGTFDPVHDGHLAAAQQVRAALPVNEIRFIPAGVPVHRGAPGASIADRLAMLHLALDGLSDMVIDEREIQRAQAGEPNYTLCTLQSLHAEMPDAVLLWVIGDDAFAELTGWYQWQKLFDEAHFVVMTRTTELVLPEELRVFLRGREVTTAEALQQQKAGLVYRLTMPPNEASATAIRTAIAENHAESIAHLLPEAVLSYIARRGLYRANYGNL